MKNEEYDRELYNEILVDCKGEGEQNMSWYYYAQDKLRFPFSAYIELSKREGGKILKKVNVIGLSSDDTDFNRGFELEVEVELDDYIIEVPTAKLIDIEASETTIKTIKIWKYWIR